MKQAKEFNLKTFRCWHTKASLDVTTFTDAACTLELNGSDGFFAALTLSPEDTKRLLNLLKEVMENTDNDTYLPIL